MKANQFIGEFDCFITLYLKWQMFRHYPNLYWNTPEKCIENLGGVDQIYNTYALWKQVSTTKQLETCGCTIDQVRFMLETYDRFELEDSDETLNHLVTCLDILGVL